MQNLPRNLCRTPRCVNAKDKTFSLFVSFDKSMAVDKSCIASEVLPCN